MMDIQAAPVSSVDLGISAFHRSEFEIASEHFQKAVEDQDRATEALDYLGQLALIQQDQLQAISFWEQSLAIEPNYEAYSNLGFLFSRMERLEEARKMLEEAHLLMPNSPDVAVQWASLEKMEENYAKAEKILAPFLEFDIPEETTFIELAKIKLAQGQADKARDILSDLIEKIPESAQAIYELAMLERNQKNFEKAKEWYEKLMQIVPDHQEVITDYGSLIRDHIDFEQGISVFKDRLEKTPQDWELHVHIGFGYESKGRLAEAIEAYKAASALNPAEPSLYHKVAALNQQLSAN